MIKIVAKIHACDKAVLWESFKIQKNGYGTMPQAGIDLPAQSHASY